MSRVYKAATERADLVLEQLEVERTGECIGRPIGLPVGAGAPQTGGPGGSLSGAIREERASEGLPTFDGYTRAEWESVGVDVDRQKQGMFILGFRKSPPAFPFPLDPVDVNRSGDLPTDKPGRS